MKKIFFITMLSICVFILVTFLTIQFVNNQSAPYEKNTHENLTKVNIVENEAEVQVATDAMQNVLSGSLLEDVPLSFSYPVSGEIGLNHSPDTLIYSKTLGEWTTHIGIDIKAKRGTPVCASEVGTIESITETANKGIEITIVHNDDYKTIYSNLSTKEMVKVGQKVEKGRVISGVGNTASFEYYEPEHLHFEVYKNNKSINPLDVLVND